MCIVATSPRSGERKCFPFLQMKTSEVEDSANVLQVVIMEAWWKAESKAPSYFISGSLPMFISQSLAFLMRTLVHNAKETRQKCVCELGQIAEVDPCSENENMVSSSCFLSGQPENQQRNSAKGVRDQDKTSGLGSTAPSVCRCTGSCVGTASCPDTSVCHTQCAKKAGVNIHSCHRGWGEAMWVLRGP